jgi:N-acetylneuraminic acid mutarotase
MKHIFTILSFLGFISFSTAQQLPDLPLPLGAGNAEVWNGSIYHFGGSNNWSGSIVYPRVYKFNGTSWSHHDTIPDNNLWDVETTLVENNVYLLGGWPNGPSLNRRYNLLTGDWTYLSQSPNSSQTWGITAEEINGTIYLFNSYGAVFAYTIATDTWTTKTANTATGSWDMSSILFNNEIYILGWSSQAFYKYSPSTDQWTKLADSPYQVGACAFGIINNLIYAVGGNAGGGSVAFYKSIIVYDITTNSWTTDELELSSKRHWMATAEYAGGLYVVGGINEFAQSVDTIEEIVPQGTAVSIDKLQAQNGYNLGQNYPNPCIFSTRISYSLPVTSHTSLILYDILGNKVATLVNEVKPAGSYNTELNVNGLQAGIYYYRLKSGNFSQSKKLLVNW